MTEKALDSSILMKPVFLTKAQREELALKCRHDAIVDHHHHRLVQIPTSNSMNTNEDEDRDRDGNLKQYRKRDRESDREFRERIVRTRVEKLKREKEVYNIREQYLGSTKPNKRVTNKPSDKSRFNFGWDNTEDTSIGDMNALYQNTHEAQFLFGRGLHAGVHRPEQRKQVTKDNIEKREEEDKHWSDNKLEEMTQRDWRIFKEDFNISYKGTKVPCPIRNWEESKLSFKLLKAVERAGYILPNPIQMAAIPLGLEQRDVIGIAETGSGKTAAFVLPMLAYISRLPPMSEETQKEGPYALVMVPTRELAQQIEDETVKLARYLGFKVVSIVGGHGKSIEEQGLKLSQGCEILIATPGRLLDCLQRRYAVLNQCNYVVLDEADRMIDMGFEPQVQEVLEAMPSSNLKPKKDDEELDEKKVYRTTYMFSATMPSSVECLARKYLRNPVVVTVGTPGKVSDLVTQEVIMVKESDKFSRLNKLIDELGDDKTVIVFANTKNKVYHVVKNLEKLGRCRVTALHSGKSQEQIEVSLEGFRSWRFNVLVATEVAARRIDVDDVAHVINYDMANTMDMYTHRIGRTGRAGKRGVATTFLTLEDRDMFYGLKQKLVECNSLVPPELARHEASS